MVHSSHLQAGSEDLHATNLDGPSQLAFRLTRLLYSNHPPSELVPVTHRLSKIRGGLLLPRE